MIKQDSAIRLSLFKNARDVNWSMALVKIYGWTHVVAELSGRIVNAGAHLTDQRCYVRPALLFPNPPPTSHKNNCGCIE